MVVNVVVVAVAMVMVVAMMVVAVTVVAVVMVAALVVLMVVAVITVTVAVGVVLMVVEHMWDPQPLRPTLPGLGTGSGSGAVAPAVPRSPLLPSHQHCAFWPVPATGHVPPPRPGDRGCHKPVCSTQLVRPGAGSRSPASSRGSRGLPAPAAAAGPVPFNQQAGNLPSRA